MKKDLYRKALRESWSFVWQHKILWVFGLFATFLGQMGIHQLFAKVGSIGLSVQTQADKFSLVAVGQDLINLGRSISGFEGWLTYIWLLVLLLGIAGFIIFIALVSQGAIIHSVAQTVAGKKKKINISEAWHVGVYHSWRLLILNIIRRVVIGFLIFATGFSALKMAQTGQGGWIFLSIVLILLTIIIGLVLSFLVIYAASYIIIEHRKLGDAVGAAWKLFIDHTVVSLEVGLIVVLLNIVLSIVALGGMVVFFALPTVVLWFFSLVSGNIILMLFGVVVGSIIFTIFLLLLGAVFTTYITTIWTYLFVHMHKHGITSRIKTWYRGVFAK